MTDQVYRIQLTNEDGTAEVIDFQGPAGLSDDQIEQLADQHLRTARPGQSFPASIFQPPAAPPSGAPPLPPAPPRSPAAPAGASEGDQAQEPQETPGLLGSFGGSVVDGFTGGWSDEIAGAGGAISNMVRAPFSDTVDFDPAEAFTRVRRIARQEQDDWNQRNPLSSAAGTTAGIGAAFLLPQARVARGAGWRSRAVNASTTGALYGGAAGLGQGEGTDRLGNAAAGATVGAALGPLAEPVIRAAATVGRASRNAVLPYFSRTGGQRVAREAAQREVGEAMASGGYTPTEAAAANRQRVEMGVPAMPADLTDQSRELLAYSARGLGPGQSAVREAIRSRQSNMASRMRSHIDETLGSTANPHQQSQRLSQEAREASRDLYREAYQTPVIMTPALREFADSPIGPQAIEAGANQIRMTPTSRRNAGSEQPFREGTLWDPQLAPHGNYRSGEVPVLETWDGAKRYIDDLEFQTDSPFQATPQGLTSDTRALDLRRRELLEELDAQVPAFAQARAAFAGPTMDRKAFQTGLEELPGTRRNTVNDAQAQMDDMSESQLAQFRLGDRTQLADQVHGSRTSIPRWGDATRPIQGNDARIDLIRAIHGDEAADALLARTPAERDAHLTYRAIDGNSATTNRQAVDQSMSLDTASQAAGQLATGRPIRAALTVLMDAGRGRFGRYGEQLRLEIARLLAQDNANNVDDAMRVIEERMIQDAGFRRRLNRLAEQMSRMGPIGLVGQSGDETGLYTDAPQ